jgi:toxin FitB
VTVAANLVVAVDTSVAVAMLLESHPAHTAVLAAMKPRRSRLTGHSLAETYAVLTRLPGDARLLPADAALIIDRVFGEPAMLSTDQSTTVHRRLSQLGIGGGAVYDGLVALAAAEHGLTLVSRDVRAMATYALVGVRTEQIV